MVQFIDKSTTDNWGAKEVVEQWHQLFSGTVYSQRYIQCELLTAAEQANLYRSTAL